MSIARPDGMAWQSRVHRLEIARLREPADRLAGQVHSFQNADPPAEFRDAAAAVLVRSYLDEQRPDEGLAVLEEHREQYGLDSEELLAMVVETLLGARRLAQDKGDTALATETPQAIRANRCPADRTLAGAHTSASGGGQRGRPVRSGIGQAGELSQLDLEKRRCRISRHSLRTSRHSRASASPS